MSPKLIFVLAVYGIFAGCYATATQEQLTNIYKKQIDLETKIQQLSKEVENIESLGAIQEERIGRLERRIEEAHLKLNDILHDVEKARYSVPSSSPKTPDDLYSVAESLYKAGNFEDAILAFQRFIDMHPRDKRVPDSYLKQGLSLIKIGRKEQAKFFFKTLIDKFPKSQEAKVAREELKRIGRKD